MSDNESQVVGFSDNLDGHYAPFNDIGKNLMGTESITSFSRSVPGKTFEEQSLHSSFFESAMSKMEASSTDTIKLPADVDSESSDKPEVVPKEKTISSVPIRYTRSFWQRWKTSILTGCAFCILVILIFMTFRVVFNGFERQPVAEPVAITSATPGLPEPPAVLTVESANF